MSDEQIEAYWKVARINALGEGIDRELRMKLRIRARATEKSVFLDLLTPEEYRELTFFFGSASVFWNEIH